MMASLELTHASRAHSCYFILKHEAGLRGSSANPRPAPGSVSARIITLLILPSVRLSHTQSIRDFVSRSPCPSDCSRSPTPVTSDWVMDVRQLGLTLARTTKAVVSHAGHGPGTLNEAGARLECPEMAGVL